MYTMRFVRVEQSALPEHPSFGDIYLTHTIIVRTGHVFHCPHCGQPYKFRARSTPFGPLPELFSTSPIACGHICELGARWVGRPENCHVQVYFFSTCKKPREEEYEEEEIDERILRIVVNLLQEDE